MASLGKYLFCFGALGGTFVYLLAFFVVMKSTSGEFKKEGFWGWHDAVLSGGAVRTEKNRVRVFIRNLVFVLSFVVFVLIAIVGLGVLVFSWF